MTDKIEANETAGEAGQQGHVKHGKSTPYSGPRNFRGNARRATREDRQAALQRRHPAGERRNRSRR